jgi:alkyl hydroperoxide reductase subunit AhpF
MIITSHMQKSIQIHPSFLLSRKQESVTDRMAGIRLGTDLIIIILDGFLHGNI